MDVITSAAIVLGMMLAMFAIAGIALFFINNSKKAKRSGGFDTGQAKQKKNKKRGKKQPLVELPYESLPPPSPPAPVKQEHFERQNTTPTPPTAPKLPPAQGQRPFQVPEETGNDW